MAGRGGRGVWVLLLALLSAGCGGSSDPASGAGLWAAPGPGGSSSSALTPASRWLTPCARGKSRDWSCRTPCEWAN